MSDSKIKRILVIHTAFIGDVILMTAFIKKLKLTFPESKIDVVVVPVTAGILKNNPNIRDIIQFNKRDNKFLTLLKLISRIKEQNYDEAYLLHSSLTSSFLAYFGKVKHRIGFDRGISRYLLTKRVTFRKNTLRLWKNLDLLELSVGEDKNIETEIFLSAEDYQKADVLLAPLKDKQLIAIAPGSVWFTKRWPEEYYKQLCKRIIDETPLGLVFIGSKAEKELCQRIMPDRNSINLAGLTTLTESAACIERCRLMICNDSGALHIANAVKTDVVAFFGPTVRALGYFPYRNDDIVLEREEQNCRPCGNHGHSQCPLGHHNCMKSIKAYTVFTEIVKRII
ncbi:MAG: lipopolysaccharide heptosyltransferase II [Candidatus Cloacimonetes bacterium]|nr:lipopolysaccharide heptosyltransferase II [Candidatus Cloacimonadota bacterium]